MRKTLLVMLALAAAPALAQPTPPNQRYKNWMRCVARCEIVARDARADGDAAASDMWEAHAASAFGNLKKESEPLGIARLETQERTLATTSELVGVRNSGNATDAQFEQAVNACVGALAALAH